MITLSYIIDIKEVAIMYESEIAFARRLISGRLEFTGECAACGGVLVEPSTIKKACGSKFTDYSGLIKFGGNEICESCVKLMDKKNLSKVIYYHDGICERGRFDIAWSVMTTPPKGKNFILSVPYSFKKHHLLFAGISTSENMLIGTDDGTVHYIFKRDKKVLEAVKQSSVDGVPRAQVMNGNYTAMTMSKFGEDYIRNLESIVKDARESGLLKLAFRALPKQEKIKYCKEVIDMLDASDVKASEILAQVAYNSGLRVTRGLDFWNQIFPHRVYRFRKFALNDMVNRLCEQFAIPPQFMQSIIAQLESLTDEESKQIQKSIENHTQLVLGITYEKVKEIKKNA